MVQENDAVAWTEAPETLRDLSRQRLRWMYGTIQGMWKHQDMLFRPRDVCTPVPPPANGRDTRHRTPHLRAS